MRATLSAILFFLLLVGIVFAITESTTRVPQFCEDSDANCIVDNINADDIFVETVNIKVNPFGYIRGYNFTNNISNISVLNNVTVRVEWRNNPTGRGADLQNISIYNTTHWVQCAGPFGDTGSFTNATCLFIGSNLTGNFTNIEAINAIHVNFTGLDNNGGSPALAEVDIIEIAVNFTPPNQEFTVLMPSSYTCPSGRYCFNLTATTEAAANETSWISFNFTTCCSIEIDVQPCVTGNCSADKQDGTGKPIFLIDNTGTTLLNLSLRFNETLPIGINVSANATCLANNCSFTQGTKQLLNTTYITIVGGLNATNSFANVSLWADKNESAIGGEYFRFLLTNTTNSSA